MPQMIERKRAHHLAIITAAALFAVLCLVVSWWLYTPWLASVRRPLFSGLLGVSLVLLAANACWHRGPASTRRFVGATLVVSIMALLAAEFRYQARRMSMTGEDVIAAGISLEDVGPHIIVGYNNIDEVKALITAGAIGGVFITARNARGKTREALAAEIIDLQATSAKAGFGRLIVATDQEGGFVSRLSPPLARPARLADVIAGVDDPGQRQAAVRAYALAVGRDLASIGVTLNFAPLADLDFGIRNPKDRMSRIGERAISTDPQIVSEVATTYCQALTVSGVRCTLKHFPGLGRVADDTHVQSAALSISAETLAATDWVPFRQTLANSPAALMLGHVTLDALDRAAPASLSKPVVTGLVRNSWGFDGLIVTDDLCMSATSDLPGGVGASAVRALQSGADLVLIAYDPAQVYPVVSALLHAHGANALPRHSIAKLASRRPL